MVAITRTSADMEVMMPATGVHLTMDCEDMFKEITKKLYGEEGVLEFQTIDRNILAAERHVNSIDYEIDTAMLKPEDHITAFGLAALMQNGFPPPGILNANFQPKINPAAEDKWTASDESLQWSQSKIASYNPAQKLFKCTECECIGFLSRIAEHWLGTHSNARVFQCPQCPYNSSWARCVRMHLAREHNIPDDQNSEALFKNNPVLEEITKYLQRLKVKVDSTSPKTPPPVQSNHQNQTMDNVGQSSGGSRTSTSPGSGSQSETPSTPAQPKRYGCPVCPYATDRRDLFTRHENIHRDEKPFECYVCQKQFNRADHVKKHFLRMHRDHPYDLNRIRRQIPKTSNTNYYIKPSPTEMSGNNVHITLNAQNEFTQRTLPNKVEHIQQIKTEINVNNQNKPGSTSKKKGEKRYSCCYCTWSGVDNWCLKRHLNTHLKPFICGLCDYKAARSERLTTHVAKVHNKKACSKCSFLADDQAQLTLHLQEQHHIENRNLKVPNTMLRNVTYNSATTVVPTFGSEIDGASAGAVGESMAAMRCLEARPREPRQHGAARLFNYMEASDGSEPEDYEEEDKPQYHILGATEKRFVQDFPRAGDVGFLNSKDGENERGSASGKCIAASPEKLTERLDLRQKKSPKSRTSNKENKNNTKECNICLVSFKSKKSILAGRAKDSCPSDRSPLSDKSAGNLDGLDKRKAELCHCSMNQALLGNGAFNKVSHSIKSHMLDSVNTSESECGHNYNKKAQRKQTKPRKLVPLMEDGLVGE